MIANLKYFLLTSFRRIKIDRDLEESKYLFKGKVLNIGGGRKRGRFSFPSQTNVTVADINKNFKPDVVCPVEKLPFKNNFFDVVVAIELFEHVREPEKGIGECIKVLKPSGYFIFSMPFMYPVHADPKDFQRWTEEKIKQVLNNYPVKIKKFKIQGYYFTVLADLIRKPILNLPILIRYFLYLGIFPLLYILVYLDDNISKKSLLLKKYHAGYFVICQKK